MQRGRRACVAVALCAFMALSVLVTAACIAGAGPHVHTCAARNCRLCRFIAQLNGARREIHALYCVTLAGALLWVLGTRANPYDAQFVSATGTLILQKTRLND